MVKYVRSPGERFELKIKNLENRYQYKNAMNEMLYVKSVEFDTEALKLQLHIYFQMAL